MKRLAKGERMELIRVLDMLDAWQLVASENGGDLGMRDRGRLKYSGAKLVAALRLSRSLCGGAGALEHAATCMLQLSGSAECIPKLPSQSHCQRMELALDCAFMQLTRCSRGFSESAVMSTIRWAWADSSPQKQYDWLWTQFHEMSLSDLAPTYDAVVALVNAVQECSDECLLDAASMPPDEWNPWLSKLAQAFTFHVCPCSAMSSGQRSLVHKCACMMHQFCLELSSIDLVPSFCQTVASFTSDMGTELSLPDFRVDSARDLLGVWDPSLLSADVEVGSLASDPENSGLLPDVDTCDLQSDVAQPEPEPEAAAAGPVPAQALGPAPTATDGYLAADVDATYLLPWALTIPGFGCS